MTNKQVKIEVSDTISMSDSVSATSWLSPDVFRKEFEKYKDQYFREENDSDLIMAYILLQIYLENHFHYYLRFLIGDGFGQSPKLKNWKER